MNILITIYKAPKGPKSQEPNISEVISYHYIDLAEATFIACIERDALPGGLLNKTQKAPSYLDYWASSVQRKKGAIWSQRGLDSCLSSRIYWLYNPFGKQHNESMTLFLHPLYL